MPWTQKPLTDRTPKEFDGLAKVMNKLTNILEEGKLGNTLLQSDPRHRKHGKAGSAVRKLQTALV